MKTLLIMRLMTRAREANIVYNNLRKHFDINLTNAYLKVLNSSQNVFIGSYNSFFVADIVKIDLDDNMHFDSLGLFIKFNINNTFLYQPDEFYVLKRLRHICFC